MQQQLENLAYDGKPVQTKRQVDYNVGNLESLSATALYTGKLPSMGPGGFGVLPKLNLGSSNFRVFLPKSNAQDNSIKISTPDSLIIVNSYQKIIGKSGVDYFNTNGSLAGRLFGLNRSELKYLKDLDKED